MGSDECWHAQSWTLTGGRRGGKTMMLNDSSVTSRYERDPAFRHLVDMMYILIHEGKYTPTELREAAILAMTRYESLNIRRRWIIPLRGIDE